MLTETVHEDKGSRYASVSSSCTKLLGYMPSELIGHDPFSLIHVDDVESVRAHYNDHFHQEICSTASGFQIPCVSRACVLALASSL